MKITGIILDMDGVIWKENQPIGDLPNIFTEIRRKGLRFTLATNNAVRTIPAFMEKLAAMGVEVQPQEIINSAMAAAHILKEKFPQGGPVYMVGEEGLTTALAEKGFYPSDDHVLAVVAGLDRRFTFKKLFRANHHIRCGAFFIGTNPDRTFPTPNGFVPGAGSILAAIEAASETIPFIAGKPSPGLYNLALERLGTPLENTLAIGDRLETDILGAQQMGCRSALVLSGVTTMEMAVKWQPQPDLIGEDLAGIINQL